MVRFIASIIAISLTGLSSAAAWPDQPIKMLVPFAAGGTTDVVARIVAERLGARLGRPLVIENVAGAGGNSGAALAAKAPADGYTILMATPGQAVMNQFMYKRMPYDTATAFVPLAYIASVPSVLVVSPTLDVSSTADFLAKMKSRPGGANFGSAGHGIDGPSRWNVTFNADRLERPACPVSRQRADASGSFGRQHPVHHRYRAGRDEFHHFRNNQGSGSYGKVTVACLA